MPKNKQKERQKKGLVIFVAVATMISLAGLTGLFGAGNLQSNDQTQQVEEVDVDQIIAATGVPCLTSEAFHSHPHLRVTVDEIGQILPANIGIYQNCIQELHTHEEDGIIHVESDVDKGYTFQDFLNVMGFSVEQPGFITRLTVNGEFNDNDTSFKLENDQEILLEFITIPSFGATSTSTTDSDIAQ